MQQEPRVIKSVIGGAPPGPDEDRTFTTQNPARLDDVVAHVHLGTPDTLLRACETAKAAQRDWARVPAPVRGQVIENIGRIVAANKESLAALVTREIGKPYGEALGEVQEIIDTCAFFHGEGRRLYGQTVGSEMPDKQLFTFRKPVGVATVITAGNFPTAVPSWYIVPALLCGNAVVWKPAEYSAAISQAFYELFIHGGIPAGVFNVVFADGEDTFTGLSRALEAGLVDKVGFTGSPSVGSRIGELCGRHLQSPCLELGGKNPMIVTEDATLELAVEGALFSGFGTAGQRCTSLGTVLVAEPVHEEFVRRLASACARARIGDPTQDVLYGPMISRKFADNYEKYLGWITARHSVHGSSGTGRITANNPRDGFVGDPDAGLFYHPVIVDGVGPDDELFRNETFGPIIGVCAYRDFDEAVELSNLPGYGLSAAIYTNDAGKAFRFRAGTSAGMLSVNNSTSGAEAHLPFGGNGRSGNGSRQSGLWVLDQFTSWQSMNWDYSGKLQKAQMDVLNIDADLDFRLSSGRHP